MEHFNHAHSFFAFSIDIHAVSNATAIILNRTAHCFLVWQYIKVLDVFSFSDIISSIRKWNIVSNGESFSMLVK